MIPLTKLARLPRHQRLRKIANVLSYEDAALAGANIGDMSVARAEQLKNMAGLLAEDEEFSPEAAMAIAAAASELESAFAEGRNPDRRSVNALRHIVNGVIGKQTADWDLVDGAGSLSKAERRVLPGVDLFLEDVRSPFNVGSIFRIAESFGVDRVLISPLCASPDHIRAARSSMGCTETVPWERRSSDEIVGPVFALETGGTPMDEFLFPVRGTLIVGSEELGVSPAALARAEASAGRVTIPTIGAKGSLNVAVAVGIVMREWCGRILSGTAGYPS